MTRQILRQIAWTVCVTTAALFCAFALTAPKHAESKIPAALFGELRKLPQDTRWFSAYYDMHGNADERIQALMIGRFEFTADICAELDRVDVKTFPAYSKVLWAVLATVKDPSSIPWLENQLAGEKRREVVTHWLPYWKTYLRGAGSSNLKWLAEPEKWAVFLEKWEMAGQQPEIRSEIQRAMFGWCHVARTADFFRRMAENPQTKGEDLLCALLYLRQHDVVSKPDRLKSAFEQLGGSDSGTKILLEYAVEFRDEATLPWLLSVVEDQPSETYGNAQWILEMVTFRRDVMGRAQWLDWMARHGSESRKAWMEQASAELIALAKSDLTAAKAFIEKANYRWGDALMLSTMEQLTEFEPLHSDILGWINLTYGHHSHEPHLRERLRGLALRILNQPDLKLEGWAKRLSQEWDFLHDDRTTWAEYIRLQNSRL